MLLSAFIAVLLMPVGAQGTGVFADGLWEGEADLGEGLEPIVLRLFTADDLSGGTSAGLIDLPARRLFGYPLDRVVRDFNGIEFGLLDGAPIGGAIELRATSSAATQDGRYLLRGAARLAPEGGDPEASGDAGAFTLAYSGPEPRGTDYGRNYQVDTGRGKLPGSLVLPDGSDGAPCPVVLILSGANEDRDGDNYSVPGRSDALAELAMGLGSRGVASLRYDRRGTGEAYLLAGKEEDLRFDDHVGDARAAISALASDARFSRVVVAGYGEGALVAAAALVAAPGGVGTAPDFFSARVGGIAALCASGKTELETVQEALSSTPEENRPEAEAIMTALISGRSYPHPSPYFSDFFRPSAQPYLASLLKYDIRAAFAAAFPGPSAPGSVLVVAGEKDLQVGAEESELLASSRPGTAFRIIPGMSHALKEVGDDEDANYASFTDPSLPLAPALVDLIEAFAKGAALSGENSQ